MKFLSINKPKEIAVVGQGCMGIGGYFHRDDSLNKEHKYALEYGIELGMTFLDTADVYADGNSEEIIGEIAQGKRDQLFIATKFSPENHEYTKVIQSAERSMKRLRTDYIDLYQVHWPNPSVPVEETMRAMEDLVASGKVRYLGVSNFSKREMIAAQSALARERLLSNQVEYNLFDRFIEQSILPHCREVNALVVAYSPLDKGRKTAGDERRKLLEKLAVKYDKTPSQIALNWLTTQPSVVVIPKSTNLKNIKLNAESVNFEIEQEDIDLIDRVCVSEPECIAPDKIRVSLEGEGNRQAYQTIEEARENKLGMSPSPEELAEFIKAGEPTKPVRLIPTKDHNGKYTHDLIEGRLRYWAWVIAFNSKKPVPAYVRSI